MSASQDFGLSDSYVALSLILLSPASGERLDEGEVKARQITGLCGRCHPLT